MKFLLNLVTGYMKKFRIYIADAVFTGMLSQQPKILF